MKSHFAAQVVPRERQFSKVRRVSNLRDTLLKGGEWALNFNEAQKMEAGQDGFEVVE